MWLVHISSPASTAGFLASMVVITRPLLVVGTLFAAILLSYSPG